jgi:hypothetical protein
MIYLFQVFLKDYQMCFCIVFWPLHIQIESQLGFDLKKL